MKHLLPIPFCILLALFAVPAASQDISAATSTLREYSAAFNRNDCKALLALMSPAYVRNLDRSGERASICTALSEMASEGVVDTPGKIYSQHNSGEYTLVLVQNERIGRNQVRQIGFYAVHSSDSGRTWHILDNGCNEEAWIKQIYPPFNSEIELPIQRLLLPPYFIR